MKKYVVMVSYDIKSNKHSIRCRGDVDEKPFFNRNKNIVWFQPKYDVSIPYYIVFEGTKSEALMMKHALTLAYQGLQVGKSTNLNNNIVV